MVAAQQASSGSSQSQACSAASLLGVLTIAGLQRSEPPRGPHGHGPAAQASLLNPHGRQPAAPPPAGGEHLASPWLPEPLRQVTAACPGVLLVLLGCPLLNSRVSSQHFWSPGMHGISGGTVKEVISVSRCGESTLRKRWVALIPPWGPGSSPLQRPLSPVAAPFFHLGLRGPVACEVA